MKFIKWVIGTLIIQPLIFLAIWNVLIVPMFRVGYTTFIACAVISVISDIIIAGFKSAISD